MKKTEILAAGDDLSHIPCPTAASYPLRSGNLVRPLIDGVAAFRRIGAAAERARASLWLTVAFVHQDFALPDGLGGLFDLLDRAAARGLDVRVIFWRPNPETMVPAGSVFDGSAPQRAELRARGSRFAIRWDRAGDAICHHQKSWLIDAGHPTETGFVGGMNLAAKVVSLPGHAEGGIHDLYLEVSGPAATDIHHNFVQRWNGASERHAEDGVWGREGSRDLAFPVRLSAARGSTPVQIQRTMPAGRHGDPGPQPTALPVDIARGERTVLAQYLLAIDAARRTIYLENQAFEVPEIAAALDAALARGVVVVALLPADPEPRVRALRADPEHRLFYRQFAALARHDGFLLAGLSAQTMAGRRDIYVHSKIMLVDDGWATIGSTNLHRGSVWRQTEMNASFWDEALVRRLRCDLFAEHLGQDTAALDDRAALALFGQVARRNRARREAGEGAWEGLAFALDPATYAA